MWTRSTAAASGGGRAAEAGPCGRLTAWEDQTKWGAASRRGATTGVGSWGWGCRKREELAKATRRRNRPGRRGGGTCQPDEEEQRLRLPQERGTGRSSPPCGGQLASVRRADSLQQSNRRWEDSLRVAQVGSNAGGGGRPLHLRRQPTAAKTAAWSSRE